MVKKRFLRSSISDGSENKNDAGESEDRLIVHLMKQSQPIFRSEIRACGFFGSHRRLFTRAKTPCAVNHETKVSYYYARNAGLKVAIFEILMRPLTVMRGSRHF